jgi:hypothetical protein
MAVTVFRQLDKALHDHLNRVARLAADADPATASELARTELPKLAATVMALLDAHQPDEHGRCPTCRTRRWRRRRPAPCRAYLTAQLCLTLVSEQAEHRHHQHGEPRPEARPESRAESRSGSRGESRSGSRAGARSEHRPAHRQLRTAG